MVKICLKPSRSFVVLATVCCIAFSAARLRLAPSPIAAAVAVAEHPPDSSVYRQDPDRRHFRGSFAKLERLLRRYGYWAAAVATLAEGVGVPMPGQTLLIAGGVESAEGRMNIVILLLVVTAAATLGNSLGYLIGYWGGRFVLSKLKVDPQRQQHLEELFKRRGGLVILFARFVDGMRQLNGIVSGTMKMPWWSFTAYNVAGAILWTGTWGFGSYYFGRRIHFIASFFHRHQPLLFALGATALLALIIYLFRPRKEKNNGRTGST